MIGMMKTKPTLAFAYTPHTPMYEKGFLTYLRVLCIVFILLHVVDALTTYFGVTYLNLTETNPLGFNIQTLILKFTVVFSTVFLIFIVCYCELKAEVKSRIFSRVCSIILIFLILRVLIVDINNLIVIFSSL